MSHAAPRSSRTGGTLRSREELRRFVVWFGSSRNLLGRAHGHSSSYCPFAARPKSCHGIYNWPRHSAKAARSMRGRSCEPSPGVRCHGLCAQARQPRVGSRGTRLHPFRRVWACAAWNLSVPPGSRVYTPSRWRRSSGSADHDRVKRGSFPYRSQRGMVLTVKPYA